MCWSLAISLSYPISEGRVQLCNSEESMRNDNANISTVFAYLSSTAQETKRSNKKLIWFIFYLFKQTCIYLYDNSRQYEQACQTFFELQSFAANACYLDLHKD